MALQNVIAVDNGKVLGVNTEKIATTNTPGIVQPDGETIDITDGVISVKNPSAIPLSVNQSYTNTLTIDYNESYTIGKLVIVNLKITASTAIAANNPYINGLPKPKTNQSSANYVVSLSSTTDTNFVVMGSGTISANNQISSGTHILSGHYISD